MINNALYKGDNELMIYWLLYKLLPNVMILSVRGRRKKKKRKLGDTHTKKKRVQTWSDTGHTQMFPCFCRSFDVITV